MAKFLPACRRVCRPKKLNLNWVESRKYRERELQSRLELKLKLTRVECWIESSGAGKMEDEMQMYLAKWGSFFKCKICDHSSRISFSYSSSSLLLLLLFLLLLLLSISLHNFCYISSLCFFFPLFYHKFEACGFGRENELAWNLSLESWVLRLEKRIKKKMNECIINNKKGEKRKEKVEEEIKGKGSWAN